MKDGPLGDPQIAIAEQAAAAVGELIVRLAAEGYTPSTVAGALAAGLTSICRKYGNEEQAHEHVSQCIRVRASMVTKN